MSKYPKIVVDKEKNSPIDLTMRLSSEQYYDLINHTHDISDIVGYTNGENGTYDDTEIKKLINDVSKRTNSKVDAVDGKSLLDDSEILRLSKIDNYDDTEIRQYFENKLKDLYNKIMGIVDDTTTVNEAYDTLKEIAQYISEEKEGGAAGILTKIAAIEETCNIISKELNSKVDSVEGKSLVSNSDIDKLSSILTEDAYGGSGEGIVKSADTIVGLEYTGSEINSAIANSHTHANKNILDTIISSGIGNKFFSDNGKYKDIMIISAEEPTESCIFWIDNSSDTYILKVYNGEEWINISSDTSEISTSIIVDEEMSDLSSNPVQNKVIKNYIDKKSEISSVILTEREW